MNFFIFNLYALEISLNGAKENFQTYSTIHFKDSNQFLCQEVKSDLDIVEKIVCAFAKQPTKEFKNIENSFFKITSQIKKKTFFVIITPHHKLKLYPMIFDLSQDNSVFKANAKLSKRWMIIGYKEKIPYIKKVKQPAVAINFPFFLSSDKLPFVGGLDIKGNPVYIKKVQDVTDYIRIKKYYRDKKYEQCLELVDEVMQSYPDSLFRGELLYYKMKVYMKLEDYDNVIDVAKVYLKEYSSDENIAEVLALNAKAYSMIGLSIDADYFFDRLFSEHEDSVFTEWGYIYKGEMLEASGASSKALTFYKKALNESEDIEVASTAAYRLAKYNITYSKPKEASQYIMKIIEGNPDYFVSDFFTSMDMLYAFGDGGDYLSAAAIAKALLDKIGMNHDEYENLLKDRGLWLAKTDKKQEALLALNEYIKKYKYGSFEEEIKIAKDSLFFDVSDANLSTKLDEYSLLMVNYQNDSIGDRAIYEKAKLLLENEMYSDILGFKDLILELDETIYPDTQSIIKESAIGVMKAALKVRECQEVLNISSEYNISLSSEWDSGIYECSMKGSNFLLAKKVASGHLKSKDLDERKKWLYRYIKIDFATGNYSEVVEASKELISLIEDDKNSKYLDIYRTIFDTYQRLEKNDEMIDAIVKLQKIYGVDYKDIERYIAVMTIGSEMKDDNLVIKYGGEVMKIQNSSSSYAQSPFVEFTLYQSYINIEDINSALEIIKSLESVELSPAQRARQKYLLGTTYSKLWREEEAQKSYQEAIEADATSAWAKLAKDAKGI
ncbi:MAG: flagellar protein [Campylobacterota bacterium]|nr:flagellar protein [Campylobacterota bacterium]